MSQVKADHPQLSGGLVILPNCLVLDQSATTRIARSSKIKATFNATENPQPQIERENTVLDTALENCLIINIGH